MKYLVWFLLFSVTVFAQFRSISGTVIDSATHEKLPAVNIIAYSAATNKLIQGIASNGHGVFKLSKIPYESIKIKCSLVGYREKTITISNAKNDSVNLGAIQLSQSVVMINGVNILAEKQLIEYKIDKQVINVDKLAGNANTVTEVIQNFGVADVDPLTKKITIHGNGVTINIDGRPVSNAEALIAQMPASFVDKIEISSVPSAKEDAQGAGGVINIISKRTKQDSYNGSVSIYKTNQNGITPSAMFNYKRNRFNIFSSFALNNGTYNGFRNISKTFYNSDETHHIISTGISKRDGNYYDGELAVDYQYDSTNTFSVTGEYIKTKYDVNDNGSSVIYNVNEQRNYSYVNANTGNTDYKNYSLGFYYKHLLDKEKGELTADIYYSKYKDDETSDESYLYDYLPFFPSLQNSNTFTDGMTFIAKSDFSSRIGKEGELETGIKYTRKNRLNNYSVLDFDYSNEIWRDSLNNSNSFRYIENIPAAYASFSQKFSKWEVKIGARMEYSDLRGESSSDGNNFRNDYLNCFPSFALSYELSKSYRITFNVARRIERPRLENINPFTITGAPNSISKGNPRLVPAFTNNYELSLYPFISVFMSYSTGEEAWVPITVNDSTRLSSPVNGLSSKSEGFDLTLPLSSYQQIPFALPKWISSLYVKASYARETEHDAFLSEDYTITTNYWNILANANLKLWYDVNSSINFMCYPKNENPKSIRFSKTFLSFSFWKYYFDNQLQVKIAFNDVLNGMGHLRSIIKGSNFSWDDKHSNKAQSVGLLIRYNFNSFEEREGRNIDDYRDGQKRLQ
jgi:hypothetical protein